MDTKEHEQGVADASNKASSEEVDDTSKKTEDDKEREEKANIGNFWVCKSLRHWLLVGYTEVPLRESYCAGIALPLMNIVFGSLVGDFNGYFTPGTSVTKAQFLAAVNKNALYIVYLFIGKFLLAYIAMFCFRMSGIRISAALRLAYTRALFAQPISVFDKLPPGKAASMITSSANTVQIGISDKLAILVQSFALVISAYAVAFKYSWALTLVSSSCILFIVVVYSALVPSYVKALHGIEKSNESASAIAGESFSSIRTIVACGAEDRVESRYAEWIAKAKQQGLNMSPRTGAQFAPAFFAIYCDFALTFWFGIRLYSQGHIHSISTVITVFFSVLIVVSTLGSIFGPVTAISKAASASTGFFTMIDTPTPNSTGFKEPDASAHNDIVFQDVTFAYPTRANVKVLDKLSVDFPAGKVTAIVGPSGSGKSTIVGLLERWYQLSSQHDEETTPENDRKPIDELVKAKIEDTVTNGGSIIVGDKEIQSLDLKWWRSQIGLVQQEPFTFSSTIFKNVAYGLVGSRWEDADDELQMTLVKEACQEAFADEFISRLPLGYQTTVGENGIKLSGGQRQRLAIARSIIKKPPILILDEATSAIDVRGEKIVQEALDRVSKNRTTISIAHRLSTVKKADKIIVLKNGAIVEQGTHQTLLENKNGVYFNLVHAQQLDMNEDRPDSTFESEYLEEDMEKLIKKQSTKDLEAANSTSQGEEEYNPNGLLGTVGLLLYEQRQLWRLYALMILSAMGCGSAYALQAFLFAQLVQVFQSTGQKLINSSNFWSLMFFIEAICIGIFYFIIGWVSNSISVYISSTYRQQYFNSILTKPIVFYDKDGNSAGSLTGQLSGDPTQLQELLGTNMALPLIAVFNVIGSVAISFSFGWKLTLVAVFSAFPLIFLAGYMRIKYEIQFEKTNAAVFAESSQFASEAIGAFRTVTALTLEDVITDRYSKLLKGHVKDAFLKARFGALTFAASDSIDLLCIALCFWYGGRLLSTREYNVIQFFVPYIAIVQGGQAAGQWASFAPNIAQASAAANRILSLRIGPNSDNGTVPAKFTEETGGATIEFKNVSFKYPTRDVPVFRDISFKIQKGQYAALVGPSGCGKTSIVSLVERFYDIQSGSIKYDGVELSSINLLEYRKKLSLVSQEPTLYQGSIRDNVIFGVEQDSVTDEEIYRACKNAEIHDFITSLPNGYKTDVGLKGVALSGGQKQRLCIARALLRNPQVLLLDEATSSLDSQSEKLVQASFERAAKGRTMIVVAHRLATIQNADVIFVFGEGGIVEKGSHRELLMRRGQYWQMCQAQALDR
ncbi:MAG: hypothetical protein MMC33_000649 [Icmadophila ericetorum]|nr:hypothetical protein [Icmadophila ericetorum]